MGQSFSSQLGELRLAKMEVRDKNLAKDVIGERFIATNGRGAVRDVPPLAERMLKPRQGMVIIDSLPL